MPTEQVEGKFLEKSAVQPREWKEGSGWEGGS